MTETASNQYQWSNFRQYFSTMIVCLIAISHGTMSGWMAPAEEKLKSNSTLLSNGPLTTDQISYVGSINYFGGFVGALSFGYLNSLFGSKRIVLFLAIPFLCVWLIIYFGNHYYCLLIARLIGGWANGGVQMAVILYITEVSNDDIRGSLGSILLFARNFGLLIAFILGANVNYQYIPCICAIIPIIFAIIFAMLPNTPRYYLARGENQKAKDALKFYKGYKGNHPQEDVAISAEIERLKQVINKRENAEKVRLADLCTRSALKGFGISIALTIFVPITACFALSTYAVSIFQRVGTSIDPYTCSIILAGMLILGSLSTTVFADRLGRRVLNSVSLMGSACGLGITALYRYLSLNGIDVTSFAFVPIVSLCFVVFVSAAGIVPLALVCSVENLPSKVRTFGMVLSTCFYCLTSFISVKSFPILCNAIDLYGTLLIYTVACLIGSVFVLFVLKETTGDSLDNVGVTDKSTTTTTTTNSTYTINPQNA